MTTLAIHTEHALQPLNTLAIPALASRYARVSGGEQLRQALALARGSGWQVLVLGGGSNVVLPDRFAGLVIHMAIKGVEVIAEEGDQVWLRAGAGEVWQDLVDYCLARGYCGLENLSLIPGTVGAAPIQNIGAYGVELDSVFVELTAIERQSGHEVVFDRDACEFNYRDSVFKHRLKDTHVITHVTFKLSKTPRLILGYAPLRQAFGSIDIERISPRDVSDAVRAIRRGKLPDPAVIPNAGSFFKNPLVPRQQFERLAAQYPDMVSYSVDRARVKLAAAWLLEKAGWRGHSQQGVGMHVDQALVLVNPGRCRSERILRYAAAIQDDIRCRFGVELEREPVVYPSLVREERETV